MAVDSHLARAGLPLWLEQSRALWVPYLKLRLFLADVVRREGIEDLGWRIADAGGAERAFVGTTLWGALRAPDALSALTVCCQRADEYSTHWRAWLQTEGDKVLFCLTEKVDPDNPGHSTVTSYAIWVYVDMLRRYLGSRWAPAFVYCRRGRRSIRPRGVDHLGGVEIRPHEAYSGFEIPADLLSLPRRSGLHPGGCDEPPFYGIPRSLSDALRLFLRAYLPQGTPAIDVAAEILGMGSRTMQRRLHHEGTSYAQVLQMTRIDVARGLLAEGDLLLGEIAMHLGYSEQSAFTRAFRSWTGIPPSTYRKLHVTGAASATN